MDTINWLPLFSFIKDTSICCCLTTSRTYMWPVRTPIFIPTKLFDLKNSIELFRIEKCWKTGKNILSIRKRQQAATQQNRNPTNPVSQVVEHFCRKLSCVCCAVGYFIAKLDSVNVGNSRTGVSTAKWIHCDTRYRRVNYNHLLLKLSTLDVLKTCTRNTKSYLKTRNIRKCDLKGLKCITLTVIGHSKVLRQWFLENMHFIRFISKKA